MERFEFRILGFGIRIFLSAAKFVERFEISNPNPRFVSPLPERITLLT
jgi:hypothetical protein